MFQIDKNHIAEIAGLINPKLTIVDARSMLIGNGPFSNMKGAKILENTNYLIICGDMNAVDHYCAMLLQGADTTFSSAQMANLNVYDARGRRIDTLLDGELFPGEYSLF